MNRGLLRYKLGLFGRINRWWAPPDLGVVAPATAFMLEAGAKVAQRYRLERVLGAGAMGRVWLAEDTAERRQVALKELKVEPGQTPAQIEESAALFHREFYAMKKLQHPGTVKVYDAGVLETGDRYLTMEVVAGKDLFELVQKKPMPSSQVFRVLLELAQVMAFVHARLFVHSDIKAENIRVTNAGVVKVMDFGLMHQLGTSAGGQLKGTPMYMAPEWPQGGVIDGRSDLYSLGVLGFYLSTGKFPFVGNTLASILDGHLHRPPPKPSQIAPVDAKLEQIILKLLEKAPGDRYASASALASALAEASGQALVEEPLSVRTSYLHVAELVGREREAAQLNAALENARAGKGRALLLGASAGTGKSRLLQEFELKVKFLELPWGQGQCRAEGLAPLAPLKQALLALVTVTPPELLQEHRPLLGKLLPSLAVERPPTFKDPAEEKSAIFKALGAWLAGLSKVRPFVICIEDLHWADSATLEHLNMVIRALAQTASLVLATFRPGELDRLSMGFQTVDEGLTDRLDLSPLTSESVQQLVSLALGGFQVPAEFIARLHQTTEGNAFFVMELLRASIEEGLLSLRGGTWSMSPDFTTRPLPTSIQEVVTSRLKALPERSLTFFRQLAPAGRVLELPLVEEVTEQHGDALYQLLDEGAERQFLQYAQGRYYFAHDTVRAAIYGSTPEADRKGYHIRLGQHFERTDGANPEMARTIGYHFSKGGEARRAIGPLLKAGDFALANKALLEATSLLREGVTLLEATPDYPDAVKVMVPVWGKLVEVGFNGHPPTCVEFSAKLFKRWETTLKIEEGKAEIQRAFKKAEGATDAARKKILGGILKEIPVQETMSPADAFVKRAELRVMQGVALAALGKAAEVDSLDAELRAEQPELSPYRHAPRLAKGIMSFHMGRFALLPDIEHVVQVLRASRTELGSLPRRLTWALGLADYLVNMYLGSGGRPIIDENTEEGSKIATDFGFSDIRLHHINTRLTRACFNGDGANFPMLHQSAMDLVSRLGGARMLDSRISIFVPTYYLERQETELAQAAVAKLVKLSGVLPDKWVKLYGVVGDACLLQQAGKPEQAHPALVAALAAAKESNFRLQVSAMCALARVELVRNEKGKALEAAQGALTRALEPEYYSVFDEIVSRRAMAAVQPQEATPQLEQCIALAVKSENKLQEGVSRLELATAILSTDRTRASNEAGKATELFEHVKANAWIERVARFRQVAARAS